MDIRHCPPSTREPLLRTFPSRARIPLATARHLRQAQIRLPPFWTAPSNTRSMSKAFPRAAEFHPQRPPRPSLRRYLLAPIPKGLCNKAQDCEERATLGYHTIWAPTPTGLCIASTDVAQLRWNPRNFQTGPYLFPSLKPPLSSSNRMLPHKQYTIR